MSGKVPLIFDMPEGHKLARDHLKPVLLAPSATTSLKVFARFSMESTSDSSTWLMFIPLLIDDGSVIPNLPS
jgi:hypothetical protein